MRPLVTMLMFLAWIVYSAMPALAAAPRLAVVAMTEANVPTGAMSHDGGHAMHGKRVVDDRSAEHRLVLKDGCPHCDGFAHMPFCAACLLIVPAAVDGEVLDGPFGSPAPGIDRLLVDRATKPLSPPPRI